MESFPIDPLLENLDEEELGDLDDIEEDIFMVNGGNGVLLVI